MIQNDSKIILLVQNYPKWSKNLFNGEWRELNELFIGQQLSTIKDNYNTKIPPQQFSGVCRIVVKMGNRNKIE